MASLLSLLVLCVLYTTIESRVIRTKEVEVPAQGLTIEIVIKPNEEGADLKVRTIEKHKHRKGHKCFEAERRRKEATVPKVLSTTPAPVPELESRLGIVGGQCPAGYVASGGFCFPDYE